MSKLTFDRLRDAVRQDAAFRAVTTLSPAGGDGDKVFPPTYADDNGPTKYAMEERRRDNVAVPTVLLDSVASQANRMELALQDALDDDELSMPLVQVSFAKAEGLTDIDRITTLEAPHRIADAIFRDSVIDGVPFRATAIGRSFQDASPRNATPMYSVCPHALVFGVWDSTGPKGGMGSKFQRVLTSEIVGYNVATGKKTASRIDPLDIRAGVEVYATEGSKKGWEVDPELAAKDKKGVPLAYGSKGNASEVNHSNIPPSIDAKAGGVTVDYAEQTAVLSLVGLRQLRFPTGVDGELLEGDARRSGQLAARTVLAALGLAAIAVNRRSGFHLRSRALLIPDGPLSIELLSADGGAPEAFSLSPEEACDLVAKAVSHAAAVGFGWDTKPVVLEPSNKLASLIRKSRDLAADEAPGAH